MLSRVSSVLGRCSSTNVAALRRSRSRLNSPHGATPSTIQNCTPYILRRATFRLNSARQIRHFCSKKAEELFGDEDKLEALKKAAAKAEAEAPTNTNFVPKGDFSIEQLREEDQSLRKFSKEVPLEEVKEDLADFVYGGFPVSGEAPSDLTAFSQMEEQAMEAIHQMSSTKDVHQIREFAKLARARFEALLAASGNHVLTASLAFHLGLACSLLKDFKATRECMSHALELDSELVPAKRYLADALQGLHKHMEAVHFYDEFFNDFPKYYGRVLNQDGALPDFAGKMTKVDSEALLADVIFSRGRSYFAMMEYGKDFAKEDFKSVVRLNSKHKAHSLLYLGMLEYRGSDYWKAIKYYDLALQTGPAHWMMYKERAGAWKALGKEERAADDERHAHVLKRQLHWSNQLESQENPQQAPEFNMEKYLEKGIVSRPDGSEKPL